MNSQNQTQSPGTEPMFDPTNPDRPVFISDLSSSTSAQLPGTSKKYSLRIVLILVTVVLPFFRIMYDVIQNQNRRLAPPAVQQSTSDSATNSLTVTDFSPQDGSIPFNDNPSATDQTIPITPKTTRLTADDERKADLKAMHAQLENYYQRYGRYPTLENMNDAGWRAANVKSIDNENLRDPDSKSYLLTATHAKNTYSYSVLSGTGGSCNNSSAICAVYRLSAVLSDGGLYAQDNGYDN